MSCEVWSELQRHPPDCDDVAAAAAAAAAVAAAAGPLLPCEQI